MVQWLGKTTISRLDAGDLALLGRAGVTETDLVLAAAALVCRSSTAAVGDGLRVAVPVASVVNGLVDETSRSEAERPGPANLRRTSPCAVTLIWSPSK